MAKNKGSKGLTKKHSPLQKKHYERHYFILEENKIDRLARHVRRNERMVEKKRAKGMEVKLDKQARKRLKELTA